MKPVTPMPPTTLVIREAQPDEHDELGRITHLAYLEVFGVSDLGEYGDELRDVAGRAADATILVAVDGGRLIGGVTYVSDATSSMAEWPDADTAGFRMLAVDPELQGSGAGRALTHACIDRARAEQRAAVVLHTTQYMERARAMYERLGFRRYQAVDIRFGSLDILGYRLELGGR